MPQQAHARRKHPLGRLVLGHIPPSAPASAPVGAQDPNWVDEEREVDEVEAHPAPATPATPGGSEGLAQQRWQALKKRLVAARKTRTYGTKVRHGPDLTQELANGVLPVMLLKMGLERDDAGDRRVPVLLNHLQVRVTDSLEAGVQAGHAIFRIELCYGDGLTRWVVYREMRDFVNLYTHYRAAALRGRLGITKPEGLTLPSGGGEEGTLPPLPKLKHGMFWGRDTHHRRAAARALRAQLEQWLCQVCRQAALRPDANRLCKFFEISALALALSGRPGVQGKQGFLGVHSPISRKGSHPPVALRFLARKNQHWCMVRESYMIIAEQLGGLKVADVFLFDMDFRITRPKRIYRHPIHRPKADDGAETEAEEEEEDVGEVPNPGLQGQDVTALLTGGQFTNMQEGRDIDEQHAHGVSAHTFYLTNSHQKLKLVAHNERQMNQFVASLQDVARRNSYAGPNRFDSFSPIRLHVNATPLIDGRDYFWAVSKALARAKDRIMIHDWWLSPELYLRRPGQPGYRLDTILRQKAEEGVKVFVILYNEVSNNLTPTDSNYSKQRLISLHRNIMVQRSPSHFQTGTFYWAHHEKMCVVDETIAFMGGLDLCFGRWDTPAHVLTDDVRADPDQAGVRHEFDDPRFIGPVRDVEPGMVEAHIWPGQDYANERVKEWTVLNRPEEDLFPRDQFPRMPWHDVGMQLVGQPARDLARHFIQRWNYLLRIKNHTREMPFLLPPADFSPEELRSFGLRGTCEAQICRSGGPWSLGTPQRVEHSIQNAYLKAIENAEHFVYIENQFFLSSTVVETTKIENHIGDALVDRILRAHQENEPFRVIIVMPLIPGFPLPIDHPDASSVRLIVEAQYRTICRGKHSIFARLQAHGVDPAEHISFYGLRNWGRLRNGAITTEQVYIHGKLCVVDDRVVICGSANINERSQRGDRDSELAVVLRDTQMIDSTMAGKPFKVGKMPHELRVRLMQEHLGVDVDALQGPNPPSPQTGTSHTAVAEDPQVSEFGTPGSKDQPPPSRRRKAPQGRFALPSKSVAFTSADFEDPIAEGFYWDIWAAVAERNTLLYRRALRVVPDDTVKTWSEYKWFVAYAERLAKAQEEIFPSTSNPSAPKPPSTPPNRPTVIEEAMPLPPPGTGKYSDFTAEDLTAITHLLESTQGHLVEFPTRWLEQESFSSQLTWQSDLLMPLSIFF